MLKHFFVWLGLALCVVLSACGGGSSSGGAPAASSSSSQQSLSSVASSSSSATSAITLAYDGFDYAQGTELLGKNGGTGWASAWNVTDGIFHVSLDSSLTGTIVSGLSYTDSAGKVLDVTGGAWKTTQSVFYGQAMRGTLQNFGTAGSSRWISFLVRQPAASAQPVTPTFNYAVATLGMGYTFGSHAMAGGVGLYDAGGAAGAGAFYGTNSSSVALAGWVEGSVGLVVIKIDFNSAADSSDTISLWVNPQLSAPGTPLVVSTAENYAELINGLTVAWGDYRDFTVDEIRIGTSFEAVTPHT